MLWNRDKLFSSFPPLFLITSHRVEKEQDCFCQETKIVHIVKLTSLLLAMDFGTGVREIATPLGVAVTRESCITRFFLTMVFRVLK